MFNAVANEVRSNAVVSIESEQEQQLRASKSIFFPAPEASRASDIMHPQYSKEPPPADFDKDFLPLAS